MISEDFKTEAQLDTALRHAPGESQRPTYKEIRAVSNPEELGPGWELIQVLEESQVESFHTYQVPITQDMRDQGCYGCNGLVDARAQPLTVRTSRFLMGRGEEGIIQSLRDDLGKTQQACGAQLEELLKLKEENKEIMNALEESKAEGAQWKKLYRDCGKLQDTIRQSNYKMERDLAALRQALGQIQFDQIVEKDGETQ